VVLCQYAPAFDSPELDALSGYAYLPMTHAWFPTERFDEVERRGNWTFGRRGDSYVGLWSWRPVAWREHDPSHTFTAGLRQPFDLVAEGGADNVWICEVGDASRSGSFEQYCADRVESVIQVTNHGWDPDGGHRGFSVSYPSARRGTLELGPDGPLVADRIEVPLDGGHRIDNPWATVEWGQTTVSIDDGDWSLDLDLVAGTRRPGRRT
jgi:hypothetical protein